MWGCDGDGWWCRQSLHSLMRLRLTVAIVREGRRKNEGKFFDGSNFGIANGREMGVRERDMNG